MKSHSFRLRTPRPLLLLCVCLSAAFLPHSPGTRPAYAITALEARNQAFKKQSEAMKLYRTGEYKKAILLLREVTNISLNSFLAFFYLGLTLNADQQYFEAVEPLKTALELEPSYIQAHIALGNSYLKLGDLAEAGAEYQRALTIQDNYAPAFEGLGRLQEARGNDQEAIRQYEKALELNVAFPEAYGSLAELYLRHGRLEDAVRLLIKAIEIKPDFSVGYTRLGIAYGRLGLTDQAIAAINQAKSLSPYDPRPPFSLAELFLSLNNLQRAEAEISKGRDLDPGGHTGPLLQARLQLARQNLVGAIAVLEEALEGGVQEARGEQAILEQLEAYRSLSARITELSLAVGHGIPEAKPYLELAALMEQTGAMGRAIELTERALEMAPRNETRFLLGYYLLRARRYAEALPLFEELAAGGSRPALLNAGLAQGALGRHEESEKSYRQYVAGSPRDPQGHLYLANSLLRLGRVEEAESSYQAYLGLATGDEKTGKVRRLVQLLESKGVRQ